MGVIFDERKYPVVDSAPTVRRTVANFNATDWAWVLGTGLLGLPIGFKTGLASGGRARIPTMYTGGIIGLMGGFCFALQNSSGRLLGLLPNEAEVEEANKRR